jgi:ERI1 exoribonuclease 3
MAAALFRNKLKHLLILDFEATCGDTIYNQEIIEFPILLYNIKDNKVLATFHEYIRPVTNPTLTEFCTTLTGITQVRRVSPSLAIG